MDASSASKHAYDVRVKTLIAFNKAEQAGKDREDALDAAFRAMLTSEPETPTYTLVRPRPSRRERRRVPGIELRLQQSAPYPVSKALGNSWCVTNVRWIGERIDRVNSILELA